MNAAVDQCDVLDTEGIVDSVSAVVVQYMQTQILKLYNFKIHMKDSYLIIVPSCKCKKVKFSENIIYITTIL